MENYVYNGQFPAVFLTVGRTNFGKTYFIQKLAAKDRFCTANSVKLEKDKCSLN